MKTIPTSGAVSPPPNPMNGGPWSGLMQLNALATRTGLALTALGVTSDPPSTSSAAAPGTLYIKDTFTPSSLDELTTPAQNPHGMLVSRAAREQGFRGLIRGDERTPSLVPLDGHAFMKFVDLRSPGRTPEQTRADLRSYAGSDAGSLLMEGSEYLNRLSNAGAKDSAVNFSLGISKGGIARRLFLQATSTLHGMPKDHPQFAGNSHLLENVIGAANLDRKALTSPDLKTRQTEEGKLAQFLINEVSLGMDSSLELKAAKNIYSHAVDGFERKNNSVVVAAGNDRSILDDLQSLLGGYKLKAPADFSHNVMATKAVTCVGATEEAPGRPSGVQRARYSSDNPEVDIYARGGLGIYHTDGSEVDGTSFASPRVAAAMAEIHRKNPGMSSARAEKLLQSQLSDRHKDSGSTINVLDSEDTSEYLTEGGSPFGGALQAIFESRW